MSKITKIFIAIITCLLMFYVTLLVLILFNAITEDSILFTIYSFTYWVIALSGSIMGFYVANKWGLANSLTGKAILLLSSGLLFQALGQILYAYYVLVLRVEDPYPSFAEVFFVGSIGLYIIGSYCIAKISGLAADLKTYTFRLIAGLVCILMMWFAFSQFIDSHNPETDSALLTLLEIIYPVGQSIFVSITLLAFALNKNLRGGSMMGKIFFLLIGLLSQYFADTFYDRAPVRFSDMLYIYSYYLVALGLILFNDIRLRSSKVTIETNLPPSSQLESISNG